MRWQIIILRTIPLSYFMIACTFTIRNSKKFVCHEGGVNFTYENAVICIFSLDSYTESKIVNL